MPIARHIENQIALPRPMWRGKKLKSLYSLVIPIVDAALCNKRSKDATKQFGLEFTDIGQNAEQAGGIPAKQYALKLRVNIVARVYS